MTGGLVGQPSAGAGRVDGEERVQVRTGRGRLAGSKGLGPARSHNWVGRWTAEEGRHAIVLRDCLTVTRNIDPVLIERGRMTQLQQGPFGPVWSHAGPGLP